jgi:hypothetical protein
MTWLTSKAETENYTVAQAHIGLRLVRPMRSGVEWLIKSVGAVRRAGVELAEGHEGSACLNWTFSTRC